MVKPSASKITVLTVDQKELLIDSVEKFPHLYKKGDASYHDSNMKENSWETISKETGMNVNALKTGLRALRDQFSRYLRALETPSGSAAVKAGTFTNFRFADRMMFLKGHMSQRKTAGNIGDEEESQPGSPIDTEVDGFAFSEEEVAEALNDDSLNSINQKEDFPKNKRKNITFTPVQRKKQATEFKYEKELISILKEQKEEDEYHHYCMSLAPRMRNFSKKQYATAKIEIEKLLFGIEFPDG